MARGPDWGYLQALVEEGWEKRRPGYRDGVVLVPLQVTDDRGPLFTTPVVQLKENDVLVGEYKRRLPTEEPRQSVQVARTTKDGEVRLPAPARYVDAVLYSHDALREGPEDESSTDCEWEVITLLGRDEEESPPMNPGTLMSNHFEVSGGTSTKMTPEEFEDALRRSFLYWRKRGMLAAE